MKRKFADKENWNRVSKKRFKLSYVNSEDFKGYISAIYIDEVTLPLVKNVLGQNLKIADKNYIWIQQFPEGKNFALTTMIDEKMQIVQWYFDICKGNKVNKKGIPYFDDLYLDIVVLPNKKLIVLDEDELEEAFLKKDISLMEYNMAKDETKRLVEELKGGKNSLINSIEKYIKYINEV
ncbi:DUF402 domain-containing protein [Haloimpatiens sp. FM7315]|uniref:DUF402 domain-containing protein n=1 Tax=Haloimpatiens sp. FM7315 TaxID=3298609 RepID=UPI0035A2A471